MRNLVATAFALVGIAWLGMVGVGRAAPPAPVAAAVHAQAPVTRSAVQGLEQAYLGGGCFWCMEASLEQLRGVVAVVNGYAGGHTANPSYEQVCSETTGHAEAVEITFDPRVISYHDLLLAFFTAHDPTTRDRQGNDMGSSYRSILLPHTPQQAATAKAVIAELTASHAFGAPIVTEVTPFKQFFTAEDYHQDYFAHHPDQPYCVFVVAPKVEKIRHQFVDRLKK